jgi:ABC-type cobalamin/Fe3+-siderophores transport system ATPase subunit
MRITLNNCPQSGKTVEFKPNSVTILVGKNGSGKSKILTDIKQQSNEAILLSNNYESVSEISTVNPGQTKQNQINQISPFQVSSLIAADPMLMGIFSYFFKTLFDIDLKIESSRFKAGDYYLDTEADGLKSIFNLIYYLVSDHKIILLDEPERFLHPSMRIVFINLIAEVAANYKKRIIISSHSNLSVRFDLKNVQILSVQKAPASIDNINEWLENLSDSTYSLSKDRQSFKDWFYYHSEVLFSNPICLVEGVSDQIILQALKNKLSFEFGLENLSIHHVASSHHEAGGKSRLHKFQKYLSQINRTFVIADKDVISSDVGKWYTPTSGEAETSIITNSKSSLLYILPLGEIEDYYFTDPTYTYCESSAKAKANKIPAAYEQASIIYHKPTGDIVSQFGDIIEMFKSFQAPSANEEILKSAAWDYLVDRYVKGSAVSDHLEVTETAAGASVQFKFAAGKKLTLSLEELNKLKQDGDGKEKLG